MNHHRLFRSLRKAFLSAFIILNIFTVLFMNRPEWLKNAEALFLERNFSPTGKYRVQYSEWLIMHYAHLVGLDNRWIMFSRLPRFNWWYVFKAKYSDGTEVVLPLPRQSNRALLERYFDFREAKFHLNIYNNPSAREAYANQYCINLPAQPTIQVY